jgi:hypothetical protein
MHNGRGGNSHQYGISAQTAKVSRGMAVVDVLAASPGPERDMAIDTWCRSVWSSCLGNRQTVIALLQEYQIR